MVGGASISLILIIIRLVALAILTWVTLLSHFLHLPFPKHLTYRIWSCLFSNLLLRVEFVLLLELVHFRSISLHIIILINSLWLCLLILLLWLIRHRLNSRFTLPYHILVLLLQLTRLLWSLILIRKLGTNLLDWSSFIEVISGSV